MDQNLIFNLKMIPVFCYFKGSIPLWNFFFLLKNLYKFVEAIFATNPYPSPNFFVWGFPHEKIYLILYAQDNLGKKFKYIFQNFLYIIAI